jgi:hypothetical protein
MLHARRERPGQRFVYTTKIEIRSYREQIRTRHGSRTREDETDDRNQTYETDEATETLLPLLLGIDNWAVYMLLQTADGRIHQK